MLSVMMLFGHSIGWAADACLPTVHLGVGGVAECPGVPDVVVRDKDDPVFVWRRSGRGTVYVVARREGSGSLTFKDGRHIKVVVSACTDQLDAWRSRAEEAGFEGLAFSCQDNVVVASSEFRQPPRVQATLRSWEDSGGLVFTDEEAAQARLQVQVFRASVEDGVRWGFNLSDPVALAKQIGEVVRSGPDELTGAMFNGPGRGRVAETRYDEREVPVEIGQPVRLTFGEVQRTLQGGRNPQLIEVETGVQLELTDVSVLSDARVMRANLDLRVAEPVTRQIEGRTVVVDTREITQTDPIRLRVNEPTVLATWSLDRGLDMNQTLPILDRLGPLNQVLGGHDRGDYQGELIVVATLVVGSPGGSALDELDALRRKGEAWREGVR